VTLDPDSASAVKDGDVDLTPGVAADVGLTPETVGTYEMRCTYPFHALLGMKGHIVVR
jgi:plastocyanin